MNEGTIYHETIPSPIIALMGVDRPYVIGDCAYRFKRPDPFPNGMAQTLPTFARGVPVIYVNGEWRPVQAVTPIIVEWSRKITVIERE